MCHCIWQHPALAGCSQPVLPSGVRGEGAKVQLRLEQLEAGICTMGGNWVHCLCKNKQTTLLEIQKKKPPPEPAWIKSPSNRGMQRLKCFHTESMASFVSFFYSLQINKTQGVFHIQ